MNTLQLIHCGVEKCLGGFNFFSLLSQSWRCEHLSHARARVSLSLQTCWVVGHVNVKCLSDCVPKWRWILPPPTPLVFPSVPVLHDFTLSNFVILAIWEVQSSASLSYISVIMNDYEWGRESFHVFLGHLHGWLFRSIAIGFPYFFFS